ncbi:MAG: ATPase [Bacillota bacterium]|nr:ATPase [Bacillota bacterium]
MRKYLLGGNTPMGFYSYYDYLIKQQDAEIIYIIKGGPGTGKSTLMKKIGKWAEANGLEADYIYCSSDPDSLDGLVIPKINAAIVDGTAPHVVDPKNPGAVDTILYMGDCWYREEIKKNKEEIISINKQIKEKYSFAYDHLRAAGCLYEAIEKLHKKLVKKEAIEKTAGEIIYSEIKDFSDRGTGYERKLFASAFGPTGYISYADTISCNKKYVISGIGTEFVLKRVAAAFNEYDYDTELFYNPLSPEKEVLHIYVPELDVGIFTGDALSGVKQDKAIIMDLSHAADKYVFEEYTEELDNCRVAMERQSEEACKIILSAKTLHDKLESFYIPNMNFEEIGKKGEEIIAHLESMI